jgi:excisionase family DNA binding protein
MNSRALTVRDICDRYGVNEHTVLTWIRNGELRAVNVGRKLGSQKPRWRITTEALQAFEAMRTPQPLPPRTRRRKQSDFTPNFY